MELGIPTIVAKMIDQGVMTGNATTIPLIILGVIIVGKYSKSISEKQQLSLEQKLYRSQFAQMGS